MSALAASDLVKRYGDGAPVIDGFTHTFTPGTITGLVGPNGSGKTTLLRLLAVLTYPTQGRVTLGDLDIHETPHAYLRRTGIVHADSALPEHLSAVELLAWVLRARDCWTDDAPDRISSLLDRLRLGGPRTDLIGTYSSGMTKKTQIAAALVTEPDVLLMDEPLRSLDEATTQVALRMVAEARDRGAVVVLASHRSDALASLVDSVIRMRPQAGVVADGEADAEPDPSPDPAAADHAEASPSAASSSDPDS
jgi:ABC-2 type transport system ATP-binding protein